MNKKIILTIISSSIILGGLSGWIFVRYIIPKINAIPLLVKYSLTPGGAPLIINRQEQIHVNEGTDTVATAQSVRPWVVGILSGSSMANARISGSGAILTSDGIIAAAKDSLPEGNAPFKVVLNDGTILPGEVKAFDPKSELALIKVNGNNLPVAGLGSTSDLQLGQRILIISKTLSDFHPQALVAYVSEESHSGAGAIHSADQYSQIFKYDPPSAPEDSVIVSLDGNFQAINTKSILITAEAAQSALDAYFKSGKIARPYFGFYYQPVSNALAKAFGLSQGIIVRRPPSGAPAVVAGSPAQQAGLREGDVIMAVNDALITADRSFEDIASKLKPGQTVKLTVNRTGNSITLNLTVGGKN